MTRRTYLIVEAQGELTEPRLQLTPAHWDTLDKYARRLQIEPLSAFLFDDDELFEEIEDEVERRVAVGELEAERYQVELARLSSTRGPFHSAEELLGSVSALLTGLPDDAPYRDVLEAALKALAEALTPLTETDNRVRLESRYPLARTPAAGSWRPIVLRGGLAESSR